MAKTAKPRANTAKPPGTNTQNGVPIMPIRYFSKGMAGSINGQVVLNTNGEPMAYRNIPHDKRDEAGYPIIA
jgi:hypothetical protein